MGSERSGVHLLDWLSVKHKPADYRSRGRRQQVPVCYFAPHQVAAGGNGVGGGNNLEEADAHKTKSAAIKLSQTLTDTHLMVAAGFRHNYSAGSPSTKTGKLTVTTHVFGCHAWGWRWRRDPLQIQSRCFTARGGRGWSQGAMPLSCQRRVHLKLKKSNRFKCSLFLFLSTPSFSTLHGAAWVTVQRVCPTHSSLPPKPEG